MQATSLHSDRNWTIRVADDIGMGEASRLRQWLEVVHCGVVGYLQAGA